MVSLTRIYTIEPYNNTGEIGLINGGCESKPSDLDSVIVVALHANSGAEAGRVVTNSPGRFTIPVGPLQKGAWSFITCLLARNGTRDLQSLSEPFTYIVRGVVPDDQIPDGRVEIPPPYQN